MAKVSKPDANPIVACLLCLVFNLGHLIINGQKPKWIWVLIFGIIPCVGCLILPLSMMDAYKTAQKLQSGKEVDENEYSVELLYKICKMLHKDAIFVP